LSIFSETHPPVLSLLLAPDRLMAKGVLERWGVKGRRCAERTLFLESVLALLYGLTLPTICREVHVTAPGLQKTAEIMAWVAIIAASCHIAQNIGALIAVNRGDIGWWLGWMRRVGKVRIALASAVALYFVALLLRLEWTKVMAAKTWITSHTPRIPLPWA
ncbi:MAG TPA: hypothetical protein VF381_15460, partial [Thermoanaerobaculia bacterium]